MEPTLLDFQRYPVLSTEVLIFVNFLVVDYHAFVPETEIWDYRTGAEMFSRTNAARTKALTQAVNKLKGMSELPSNTSVGDSNHDESEQTSGNEVDVYEFHNEDALSSDEQITPFSQAGRKTNSTVQDLQSSQLNYLEPKVVLERHIGDEYAQKDRSVKTIGREENLTKKESNTKIKKHNQQGKKTKDKGKAKELPKEKNDKKIKKRKAEKTEQKIKEPVENAKKVVKKKKVEKKKSIEVQAEKAVEEPAEKAEEEPAEKAEEEPAEKTAEEPEKTNMERDLEPASEEIRAEKRRSGRAIRKFEPYQVKPKEKKPREKKNPKSKVKIQNKRNSHTAQSVLNSFQESRAVEAPQLRISLLNMPDRSVGDSNHEDSDQTSGNEVDVYEFPSEDALSSDEQITPFFQAGRKTNSTVQDLQTSQLNCLEPIVVLERHIGDEYAQKDKSVKTIGREENLTKRESNTKIKKHNLQGKKTKDKGKAKEFPKEKNDKVKKRKAEKTEQKIKEPVENAKQIVKKKKVEKKKSIEEQAEKAVEEPAEAEEELAEEAEEELAEEAAEELAEEAEELAEEAEEELAEEAEEELAEEAEEELAEEAEEELAEEAEEEPEKTNMEKDLDPASEEIRDENHQSGRGIRKFKPYQVKPKEKKPREKKNPKSKVKIQNKRNSHTAQSVLNSFQESRAVEAPQLRISLLNMPDHVIEVFRRDGEQQEPSDAKFGFMGLGTFGKRLATKLLLSFHKVYLWDKAEWKAKKLVDDICKNGFFEDASLLCKSSPEELVKECDIIFVCVSDFRTIECTLHEYRGFFPALKDKGVVNFTTMTSANSERFKKKVEKFGGRYLTVGFHESTEDPQADKFQAIVSGDEKLLADCLTCLAAISNTIYYVDSSSLAADVAKLLDVFTPSFSVSCSTFLSVGRSHNVEPSFLLPSYDVYVRNPEPVAVNNSNRSKRNTPHLCNYLSPKVISERLQTVVDQVNNLEVFPMIETLNEMYKGHKE
ncbi:uncharacterized abhydrolase domain-containing protein DDB_G0269086-like [Uloborus diversus]|uniref:uncharacterized abhydrolase domain-containing protein DDB_G0269086-like n=1 Tax=Uloborus diversus TaxID=327109 RepID=UPI002409854E|nr:uncharacterized abhydrolase domain-containing protein DDB_G0269086-like [Uloborus diversus]